MCHRFSYQLEKCIFSSLIWALELWQKNIYNTLTLCTVLILHYRLTGSEQFQLNERVQIEFLQIAFCNRSD